MNRPLLLKICTYRSHVALWRRAEATIGEQTVFEDLTARMASETLHIEHTESKAIRMMNTAFQTLQVIGTAQTKFCHQPRTNTSVEGFCS